MAEIINLRRARKEQERHERASQADANRRRFGRTKGQKALEDDAASRQRRDLDGKLLERDEGETR